MPESFARTLDTIKIVNLDVVPSLGLQCRLSRFDYIDNSKMTREMHRASFFFLTT
jgi:hypothetical protein